MSIQSVR